MTPLSLQFQMSAQQALRIVRRSTRVNRQSARQLRSILQQGREIPQHLWPLVDLVFLVQTLPPTSSLH